MSPHDRVGDACNTRSRILRIADMLAMHNPHKRRTIIEPVKEQWFYQLMIRLNYYLLMRYVSGVRQQI